MPAAIRGVIFNPPSATAVQPRLEGLHVRFHPVDTRNRGVEVKEDGRAAAVLPEDPDGRRKSGQRLSKSALVLLGIGLPTVTRQANTGLTCEKRRK